MSRAVWRKSTRSGPNCDNCVEVATLTGGQVADRRVTAVRDSTDPAGPVLVFTATDWSRFLDSLR